MLHDTVHNRLQLDLNLNIVRSTPGAVACTAVSHQPPPARYVLHLIMPECVHAKICRLTAGRVACRKLCWTGMQPAVSPAFWMPAAPVTAVACWWTYRMCKPQVLTSFPPWLLLVDNLLDTACAMSVRVRQSARAPVASVITDIAQAVTKVLFTSSSRGLGQTVCVANS